MKTMSSSFPTEMIRLLNMAVALLLLSCTEQTSLQVRNVLRQYDMKSIGDWKNDTTETRFSGFSNVEGRKFLLIAINKKGDTLLKFLGVKERAFRNFYKKGPHYILEINNTYLDDDYNRTGAPKPNSELFYIDSLQFFRADTTSHSLIRLKRTDDKGLINMAKAKFKLKGDYKMVHSPINKWFTISKDTLNGLKVYYEVGTAYKVKQPENPEIAPVFQSIQKIGLYKNNVMLHSHLIGCTTPESQPGSFCVYANEYYRFSQTLTDYGFQDIDFIEIAVANKGNDLKNVILNIPKANFTTLSSEREKNANAGVIADVRIDLFRFGSEYFITTFLPFEDEIMENYPPVFHINASHTSAEKVLPFRVSNNNYKVLPNPEILSEDQRKRATSFIQTYNIVTNGSDYRLQKKY